MIVSLSIFPAILILSSLLFVLSLETVNSKPAFGQERVENTYFSIEIPDTWAYVEFSNTGMADLFGRGPGNMIVLAPSEFANLLTAPDENDNSVKEELTDGSALSTFRQDTEYNLKNAPLEAYVKFKTDQLSDTFNVTSIHNSTIDNEKAVKLTKNGIEDLSNQKIAEYLILHDKEPYIITYSAGVNQYDKYLTEFEAMVKSFRFEN
jgi:hypothetical protein